MNTLIIGAGDVGKSLYEVLKPYYPVIIRDKKGLRGESTGSFIPFSIIHICFPYFKGFEKEVKKYQKRYDPKYTIIHSTIPVGTSRKCRAYYSPIRGGHPNLTKSIKTFVKYLGPKSMVLKRYFERARIKIEILDKPETIELLKILSTTYYTWNIVFCKEAKKICDKYKLDFEKVYTRANETYNEGYKILGRANVIRPVLEPTKGPISGHCLIPNCRLLKSEITAIILKLNKRYSIKTP